MGVKKLKAGEVFAILLGAIIGWGSFMLPGTKFLHTSGVINTSIGIFLGTMCILLIERSYRFMMQQDINEDRRVLQCTCNMYKENDQSGKNAGRSSSGRTGFDRAVSGYRSIRV